MKTFLSILFSVSLFSIANAESFDVTGTAGSKITLTEITSFDEPWAMAALPDGSMLVTTKPGKLFLVKPDGKILDIKGVPKVAYGGQGGLGDVVLHPNYAKNRLIYISFVGKKRDRYGAEVAKAKLVLYNKGGGKLSNFDIIWRQKPKVTGKGHFSHRLAFGPKGSEHEGYLFITSGDRQKREPAQEMHVSLGKIIRVKEAGAVPKKKQSLVRWLCRPSSAKILVDRPPQYARHCLRSKRPALGHRNGPTPRG